ncbi:MAG: hypothetical protein IPM31_13735 [Anaerolineae bacterium]|nr:hypothetical protein [Anaerolineae bacterium]
MRRNSITSARSKTNATSITTTSRRIPPGEGKRTGGQSRREVGHGALAERALEPVIPAEDSFPYKLRVVSGSVVLQRLDLDGFRLRLDTCVDGCGRRRTKPRLAGVAMGTHHRFERLSRYKILTDISCTEDHLGDMDFKVAGTPAGITALPQMDIKISGLSAQMMTEALEQAKVARIHLERCRRCCPNRALTSKNTRRASSP